METRDGATYFAERVWGVELRYDLGDEHSLVGRSAPDFELVDGTRLNERLRTGRGLLLDFDGRASLRTLVADWGDRVDYVTSDAKERLGVSSCLVRPDGVVAWVSDSIVAEKRLAREMIRWFGESRTGTAAASLYSWIRAN